MYTHAYIIGISMIFPLWLIIFVKRKDLRLAMTTIGFYVGVLAIFTDFIWFLKDYWDPLKQIKVINLIWQDFLLGFLLGGVLSIAYEFLFNKKFESQRLAFKKAFFLLLILLSPFLILTNIFKINSIYSSTIGLLLDLSFIIFFRRELIINSIISGLLSFMIAIIGLSMLQLIFPNIFTEWWFLNNLSGKLICKIPIEELIWFSSFGMITGTLYRFLYTK